MCKNREAVSGPAKLWSPWGAPFLGAGSSLGLALGVVLHGGLLVGGHVLAAQHLLDFVLESLVLRGDVDNEVPGFLALLSGRFEFLLELDHVLQLLVILHVLPDRLDLLLLAHVRLLLVVDRAEQVLLRGLFTFHGSEGIGGDRRAAGRR